MRAEADVNGRVVPPRAYRDRTSQTFDPAQHPVDIGLLWVDCTSTYSSGCAYDAALLQPTITCDGEREKLPELISLWLVALSTVLVLAGERGSIARLPSAVVTRRRCRSQTLLATGRWKFPDF